MSFLRALSPCFASRPVSIATLLLSCLPLAAQNATPQRTQPQSTAQPSEAGSGVAVDANGATGSNETSGPNGPNGPNGSNGLNGLNGPAQSATQSAPPSSAPPLPAQPGTDPASSQAAPAIPGQAPAAVAPLNQEPAPPDPSAETAASRTVYSPNQVQQGQVAAQAPIDSLILRAPQESTLNSNASSVQYADRQRGAFALRTEATGVYTSNLSNALSSAHSAGGAYFDLAVPVGYRFTAPETSLRLFFRGSYTAYPSRSELNHQSAITSVDYVHNTSERTTWDFSLAGGRIESVDGYLPATVAVGSTGVVQSNWASSKGAIYNAAASFSMTHRFSSINTMLVTATGAFLEQPEAPATATARAVTYRNQTGALDLQFQHALAPTRALGFELTSVYVNGLSPAGHTGFHSVEATYRQALPHHWSALVAGGPLYTQSAMSQAAQAVLAVQILPTGQTVQTVTPMRTMGNKSYSYNAGANLDYQTSYAHIGLGFRRVLQLGYLGAASPALEYFVLFDRPLTRNYDLTMVARDVRTSASSVAMPGYSNLSFSGRLSRQITPSLFAFVGSNYLDQSGNSISASRQELVFGFTYDFGSTLARKGLR